MRIPRIFYPFETEEKNSINLNIAASHHLKVINIKKEQNVELFNGNGYFFNAKVIDHNKKNIVLERTSDINFQKKQIPSINIAVAEIKSFDKVIREVCQAGIDSISSLKTKKTKFSKLPSEKKIMRWKSIAFNSCEQSGLNWVPKIYSSSLQDWIAFSNSKCKIFAFTGEEGLAIKNNIISECKVASKRTCRVQEIHGILIHLISSFFISFFSPLNICFI